MRKYLKELGMTTDDIVAPGTTNQPTKDGLAEKFEKERAEWGYDSRETYSLDQTAAVWLYEHLCIYKDVASEVVDLEYNKYELPTVVVDDGIWAETHIAKFADYISTEKKTLTLLEGIELCMSYLKDFLHEEELNDDADEDDVEDDSDIDDDVAELLRSTEEVTAESLYYAKIENIKMYKGQTAFKIFAEMLPSMWW